MASIALLNYQRVMSGTINYLDGGFSSTNRFHRRVRSQPVGIRNLKDLNHPESYMGRSVRWLHYIHPLLYFQREIYQDSRKLLQNHGLFSWGCMECDNPQFPLGSITPSVQSYTIINQAVSFELLKWVTSTYNS